MLRLLKKSFSSIAVTCAAIPLLLHAGCSGKSSLPPNRPNEASIPQPPAPPGRHLSKSSFNAESFFRRKCARCHGHASTLKGKNAESIRKAIARNYGNMGRFAYLSPCRIEALGALLK